MCAYVVMWCMYLITPYCLIMICCQQIQTASYTVPWLEGFCMFESILKLYRPIRLFSSSFQEHKFKSWIFFNCWAEFIIASFTYYSWVFAIIMWTCVFPKCPFAFTKSAARLDLAHAITQEGPQTFLSLSVWSYKEINVFATVSVH